MSYEQTLYKILPDDYINPKILKKNNRFKKWEYGYNKDYDFVVISKNGTIGEIYEIQNLKIALPAESECYKRSNKKEEQYWEVTEYTKELSKIKNVFDWDKYPEEFKEKYYDYIDEEFSIYFVKLAKLIRDVMVFVI